ncbi:unnamed protein product [Darwinula stevensoni]|uniref:Uncharacterized protein n=1 Tax=Darwinula stevensoni TaxID=69355 RepID=A0A7R9A4E2_9CRUS|nr:unnamed protein product [Darwinula stevensoni]CAG0892373.1 unnamed protein product [Darwinula stevensoni]
MDFARYCLLLLFVSSRIAARYDHVPSSFDWTAEPSLREFLVDHTLSPGFLPGCVKRMILDETAQLKFFTLDGNLVEKEVFVGLREQKFPTYRSCLLHVLWLEDDIEMATRYLQRAVSQWQTRSSDFYLLLFGQKIGTAKAKGLLPSLAGGGNFLNIAIVSHFNDKIENLLFYEPEISFAANVASVRFLTSWRQWKRERIEEERRETGNERKTSRRPLSEEIFRDRFSDMRGKVLSITYWKVWVLIALTWFSAATFNWILARYGISQPPHLPSDFMRQALRLSMARHKENKRATTSNAPRVWRISWLVFAYITTLCYASLLISFLAIPKEQKPIDLFEDLAASNYFVTVERGSLEDLVIQNSTDMEIGPLNEKMRGQPPALTYLDDEDEGIEHVVKNGRSAFIYSRNILEALVKTTLSLEIQEKIYISHDNFMQNDYVWPARKGAAWIPSFNKVIRRCVEAGLVDRWTDEFIQQYRRLGEHEEHEEMEKEEREEKGKREVKGKRNEKEKQEEGKKEENEDTEEEANPTNETSDETRTLQLIHFQGAFVILAVGWALAAVAFIEELIIRAKEKADAQKRSFTGRNQLSGHSLPRSSDDRYQCIQFKMDFARYCLFLLFVPSRIAARYDHVPSSFDWTAEPSLREFLVDQPLSPGFLPGCVKRLILDETAQLKFFALDGGLAEMELFLGLPQQEFATYESCLLHVLWLEDDPGLATEYLQQALSHWQTGSSDFFLLLFGQEVGTRRAKAVLPSLAYAGDFIHIVIASHFVEKVQRASQAPESSFSGNVTSVKLLTSWRKWKRDQLRIEEDRQENRTQLEDFSARPLSEEIFQDRFSDMRGKVLRVTYLKAFPHVWEWTDETGGIQLVGWETQLLEEIARRRNVVIDYMKSPDGTSGRFDKAKKKWTGMFGQVVYGEADLAIGAQLVLPDAHSALDFSTPFSTSASTFIIQKPGHEPRWKALILPFQWPVWVLVILSWFVAATFNWILARYGVSQLPHLPVSFMGQALRLSMARHVEEKQATRSNAPRVWRLFWLYFAFFTALCYSTLLTSYLAIPAEQKPVDLFEDLAISDYFLMLERDSLEFHVIHNSTDDEIGPLNEKLLLQPPELTYLESEYQGIENVVMNDQNAFIYSRDILEALIGTTLSPTQQEKIHISKDDFMQNYYIWPARKGAPWIPSFNKVIRSCVEAGLVDRWKRESIQHYRQPGQTDEPEETPKKETATESDDTNESLQLIYFQGAFIILGLGCAIAIVAFIDELCVHAKEKADAQKRDFIQRNQRMLHQFARND